MQNKPIKHGKRPNTKEQTKEPSIQVLWRASSDRNQNLILEKLWDRLLSQPQGQDLGDHDKAQGI